MLVRIEVGGFWFMMMYDDVDCFMVENEIDCYKIGIIIEGFIWNDDGMLIVYIVYGCLSDLKKLVNWFLVFDGNFMF